MSEKSGCCMQRAPNSVALRMPDQRATGCGSRHRKSPTGGAAKGMPRKIRSGDGAGLGYALELAALDRDHRIARGPRRRGQCRECERETKCQSREQRCGHSVLLCVLAERYTDGASGQFLSSFSGVGRSPGGCVKQRFPLPWAPASAGEQ